MTAIGYVLENWDVDRYLVSSSPSASALKPISSTRLQKCGGWAPGCLGGATGKRPNSGACSFWAPLRDPRALSASLHFAMALGDARRAVWIVRELRRAYFRKARDFLGGQLQSGGLEIHLQLLGCARP